MKATQSKPSPLERIESPLEQLVRAHRDENEGEMRSGGLVRLLHEAIVRGILGPGRALRQDDLARMFGVSKIPLREALRTLEAWGFVELQPNRGAIVKEMTATQLRDVFELRLMIEPYLMGAAVKRLSDVDIDDAELLVELMGREGNAWAFSKLNWKFHKKLYSGANRPTAMQILAMLQGHTQRGSFMQLSLSGFNSTSNEDHRAMVLACRKRDVDGAVRLVSEHIRGVMDIVLNLYNQHGDTAAGLQPFDCEGVCSVA